MEIISTRSSEPMELQVRGSASYIPRKGAPSPLVGDSGTSVFFKPIPYLSIDTLMWAPSLATPMIFLFRH